MNNKNDINIISDLASQYKEASCSNENRRRIELLRAHNEKKTKEMPMLAELGLWNYWVRQMIYPNLKTKSEMARQVESFFKYWLFMFYECGDDRPLRKYYSVDAVLNGLPIYGVGSEQTESNIEGGAYHIDAVIHDSKDFKSIKKPCLTINDAKTKLKLEQVNELIDGRIEVDLCKGPFLRGFNADISQQLGYLMGIENFMLFPLMYSDDMHNLLSRMRDGVFESLKQNERDGNVSQSASFNQSEPYFDDIPDPIANKHGCKLKSLAAFFAAQEYTSVSPKQFEEFLLQYQRPIMELYGHVTYGCCENLTDKIEALRTVKSLHTIAVTPSADVQSCAKQIGKDYVISWRPNPTDTVSTGFDVKKIRELLHREMDYLSGTFAHLMLKDVETVAGEPDRIKRFFDIARQEKAKIN